MHGNVDLVSTDFKESGDTFPSVKDNLVKSAAAVVFIFPVHLTP